jgi:hypothetical protein
MPRRNLYILLAAIAAAILIAILVIAACGGDDNGDDDDNGDSEPTVSVSPTNEPEESPDETAEPTGDDKTPGPEETPTITEEPGPTPIPATPNPSGVRATVIEDPQAWFSENYPGVSPGQEACDYSQVTVLVTCGGVDYAPDPPLVAAGVECFGMLVNNERVALRCNIPDVTTYYYDIQE